MEDFSNVHELKNRGESHDTAVVERGLLCKWCGLLEKIKNEVVRVITRVCGRLETFGPSK